MSRFYFRTEVPTQWKHPRLSCNIFKAIYEACTLSIQTGKRVAKSKCVIAPRTYSLLIRHETVRYRNNAITHQRTQREHSGHGCALHACRKASSAWAGFIAVKLHPGMVSRNAYSCETVNPIRRCSVVRWSEKKAVRKFRKDYALAQ